MYLNAFDRFAPQELQDAAARANYTPCQRGKGKYWLEWDTDTEPPCRLSRDFKTVFPDPLTFRYEGGLASKPGPNRMLDHSIPVFYLLQSRDIDDSNDRTDQQFAQAVSDYKAAKNIARHRLVAALAERDALVEQLKRVRDNLGLKVIPGSRSLLQAWVAESEWFVREHEPDLKKVSEQNLERLRELWGRAEYLWGLFHTGVEISVIEQVMRNEESRVAEVTPPFLFEPFLRGLENYGWKRDSILIPAQKIDERRKALEWLITFSLQGESMPQSVKDLTEDPKKPRRQREEIVATILLVSTPEGIKHKEDWKGKTPSKLFEEVARTEGEKQEESANPYSIRRHFSRYVKPYPGKNNIDGWFELAMKWQARWKTFEDNGQDIK